MGCLEPNDHIGVRPGDFRGSLGVHFRGIVFPARPHAGAEDVHHHEDPRTAAARLPWTWRRKGLRKLEPSRSSRLELPSYSNEVPLGLLAKCVSRYQLRWTPTERTFSRMWAGAPAIAALLPATARSTDDS